MAHKSICRNWFEILPAIALGACWLLAGCDSAPAAEPPQDAAAKTKVTAKPPSRPGTLSPVDPAGPKRLEAKRATTDAPKTPGQASAKADPPAPAGSATPKSAAAPASAAAASSGGTSTPATKAPSAAERAAAERMLAEGEAKRRQESEAAAARAAARSSPDTAHGSWSVLLLTTSGSDAAAAAATARDEVARRYPVLRDAFVHVTTRGGAVMFGHFDGPQDPAAKAALKTVKEQADSGGRAFPRAMLTRTGASADNGPPGPNDLRSVRRTQPEKTLYTLQVAVWSALGSDDMKMSEVKRSAEAYCKQLRTQGNEAYYFHDFDSRTSTVCVGVFGDGAYDPRSTLYAPEVEAVMRKFPKHLVNGEELLIPADPSRPDGKSIPQAPRLVEIPKF